MSDFRRGMAAFDRGDFDRAVACLEAHARRRPSDERALLWLGRARAESGRTDEALTLLREVAARRPGRGVAPAFAALVLLDAGRFQEAEAEATSVARRAGGRLAEAVGLLAAAWRGAPPSDRMPALITSTTPDVAGRALHLAETRVPVLPPVVLRDTLDETGLGWPGYRLPPPWLFRSSAERRVWRAMARGQSRGAYEDVASWKGLPVASTRGPTMVTAAMMAGEWDAALRWAERVPRYRAFAEGKPPRRALDHFQLALLRGVCTLLKGDEQECCEDLALAARLDGTSYLPRYFLGKAFIRQGCGVEARREFVAVCQRLNPSVAVVQWKAMLA